MDLWVEEALICNSALLFEFFFIFSWQFSCCNQRFVAFISTDSGKHKRCLDGTRACLACAPLILKLSPYPWNLLLATGKSDCSGGKTNPLGANWQLIACMAAVDEKHTIVSITPLPYTRITHGHTVSRIPRWLNVKMEWHVNIVYFPVTRTSVAYTAIDTNIATARITDYYMYHRSWLCRRHGHWELIVCIIVLIIQFNKCIQIEASMIVSYAHLIVSRLANSFSKTEAYSSFYIAPVHWFTFISIGFDSSVNILIFSISLRI